MPVPRVAVGCLRDRSPHPKQKVPPSNVERRRMPRELRLPRAGPSFQRGARSSVERRRMPRAVRGSRPPRSGGFNRRRARRRGSETTRGWLRCATGSPQRRPTRPRRALRRRRKKVEARDCLLCSAYGGHGGEFLSPVASSSTAAVSAALSSAVVSAGRPKSGAASKPSSSNGAVTAQLQQTASRTVRKAVLKQGGDAACPTKTKK